VATVSKVRPGDLPSTRRELAGPLLEHGAIDALAVAAVAFDREGKVAVWSGAAERLLGRAAEALLGETMPIDEGWLAELDAHVRRALASGAETAFDLTRPNDGAGIELRVVVAPVRDGSDEVVGAVMTAVDITEEKRIQRELERKADTAGLLLEAARHLGETLDPRRVYDRFHDLLTDAIQHDGVVVSSYEEATNLIHCEYAWVDGNRLDPAIFPPLPLNPHGEGMQSKVIVSGKPLLINDVVERVQHSEGTYYNVDREGTVHKIPETGPAATKSALMVPVKHEGRVVGVVQLMSDRGAYTNEQLELVEGLVAQMAAADRNARLYREAKAETAARVQAEAERRRLEAAEAVARAAAAEREQAAQVLEAVGDGIFLVDDGGVVRLWNRAAELVTGLSGDDVRGRSVADVFPTWSTIAQQVPVAEGGAAARSVTLPLDKRGDELWLSFVAVRSTDGVVYAVRDLTSERRLEERKSEFIATVSHELRTPMTAVLGAARTLLRPDVEFTPELSRSLLEMIATEAARLGQITEEVLLASRLDQGEVPVRRARVELRDLTSAVVETMTPQLPETISLELHADVDTGAALGDADRIQQVLVNLIDNAVKYSPGGGTVSVSLEPDGDVVRLLVSDEGLGIPLEEQEAIFEKFYRLDPQLTHAPSGTGLGLYICRELVRRMEGRIDVRSEPGVGSTFTVELARADR
jgi:PAS domain S-box-containing protein